LAKIHREKQLGSPEKGRGTVLERAKDRFWVNLATKNWLTTLEAEAGLTGLKTQKTGGQRVCLH
jgi:hypothetical protein